MKKIREKFAKFDKTILVHSGDNRDCAGSAHHNLCNTS